MDLALLGMKKLRQEGKLEDLEVSDEINACSIVVPVEIDGVTEEWLVNFKTRPTTIRLRSSRLAVPQPVWVVPSVTRFPAVPMYTRQCASTGAADPTKPFTETLKGKLPQRKLVNSAANGYSSYGNQIGLATGYVKKSTIRDMWQNVWKSVPVMGSSSAKIRDPFNIRPGR